ncbi:MAG: hypothetical protein WAP03_17230 [Methylorubrum rhodinum]|uniref:hypothetical protein n=1 Tax=Methylorubrum rhodinum TaxID=29428 RepID=UPI003BB1B11A
MLYVSVPHRLFPKAGNHLSERCSKPSALKIAQTPQRAGRPSEGRKAPLDLGEEPFRFGDGPAHVVGRERITEIVGDQPQRLDPIERAPERGIDSAHNGS